MKVKEVIENEDGSCDCRLILTPKETEVLISIGFNKLLLELVEEQSKIPALLRKKNG